MIRKVLFGLLAVCFSDLQAQEQTMFDAIGKDLNQIGYEIKPNEDRSVYTAARPASMYENKTPTFIVGTMAQGQQEVVTVSTVVAVSRWNDSDWLIEKSLYFLIRNTEVPCASYTVFESEADSVHVLVITRSIEAGCYSKQLLRDVLDCIDNELDRVNESSGYAGQGESKSFLPRILGRIMKLTPEVKARKDD